MATEYDGEGEGKEQRLTMGVLLESADSSGKQRSRRGAALIEAVLGSVKKRKQGKKTVM